MPLVSIIVPVYNTEKYLGRCLDSLLAQSFDDFELLLIDDGSTDSSGRLCDEYGQKDTRVSVFHQQNKGVGAARNQGVLHAQGKWILFVDSDDYVEKDYISVFLDEKPSEGCLVIQGRRNVLPTGETIELKKLLPSVYERGEICNGVKSGRLLYSGGPFCKLYDRGMIVRNKILFPEDYMFGEDAVFFFRYLACVRRMILIAATSYIYVHYSGNSLSTVKLRPVTIAKFSYDSLDALRKVDEGDILLPPHDSLLIKLMLSSMFNLFRIGCSRKDRLAEIRYAKECAVPAMSHTRPDEAVARTLLTIFRRFSAVMIDNGLIVLYRLRTIYKYFR